MTNQTQAQKKYEFTGETKEFNGVVLQRIRRISDQLLGGCIEKEENLSQEGTCFVYGNAEVYGNAKVSGNAEVYGNALVYGYACVNARMIVRVSLSKTPVSINTSDNYTCFLDPATNKIQAGCRDFTREEAVKHWTETRGGTELGEERLRMVRMLYCE